MARRAIVRLACRGISFASLGPVHGVMEAMSESVCVVGLGYVGLPTAAMLASRGWKVIGVDTNDDVVQTINGGAPHIAEPDLDVLVQAAIAAGRLRAATYPVPAENYIIAVPTPVTTQHVPDLSYVEAASRAVARVLNRGSLVVIESTCPIGTTERVAQWMAEVRPDLTFPHQMGEEADVCIAYCPERVLPGQVLRELMQNDRVIGGMTPRCARRALALYDSFVLGDCMLTDARTAEMVKLAENAFRDVNIAFANELANLCDLFGLDVWTLIALANRHPRVNILRPGPGVGGHCIPVDPWFIVHSAGVEARLIRTAREVNDDRPGRIVSHILKVMREKRGRVLACLGLAYKADVGDVRESPALKIVHALARKQIGEILVVEPCVADLPPDLSRFPYVRLVKLDEALRSADVIAVLVDHTVFKRIDRNLLQTKLVIETRGIWR